MDDVAKPRSLSLFVFIDALGWEVVQRHGFLAGICPHRQAVATIFGYSASCHPTIYTGLLPRDHGHFSFFIYDPPHSPFGFLGPLAWLPQSLTSRGRVRHIISRITQRLLGYTGYFQLYNTPFALLSQLDYTEKRDLYQPGGINSGAPTIFDHLRAAGTPFHMSDWRCSDEENFADMQRVVEQGEVAWAELFLGSLDGLLHRVGPDGDEVAPALARYEERLEVLVAAARQRYERVRVFAYGDHGMAAVTGVVDLMGQIEGLGLTWGRDYAAVYDSTMARFWFLRPGSREAVEGLLRAHPQGRVLDDDYLRQQGVDFPGQRYGQLYFLLDPGLLIVPSFMLARPLAGMHGYDPLHVDSVAGLVGSEAPALKVERLDHINHLMRHEAEQALL
mgnify:CR=1 FL=1